MQIDEQTHIYITGGSSGIGFAIAQLCIEAGARVYLFARNRNKLETAREKLIKSTNAIKKEDLANKVTTYPLDITNHLQVEKTFTELIQQHGVPHMLIHCAGSAKPNYFDKVSYQEFSENVALNLQGTWSVVSIVAKAMKDAYTQGNSMDRSIVTCSSIAGFIGTFGYTAYSASKFGVIGLSETLRAELKPYNISVSVLCPPDTDTPGFEEESRTKPPETVAISGKVRLVSPEYVANRCIRAVGKKKFMIIPGSMGKFSFFLKTRFPWLLYWIMDRSVNKEQS